MLSSDICARAKVDDRARGALRLTVLTRTSRSGNRKRGYLTNEILHHSADYTPYEGLEIVDWPVGGNTVMQGKSGVKCGNRD